MWQSADIGCRERITNRKLYLFQAADYVETTFEHQYLVKSPEMEEDAVLWWMRPKGSFDEPAEKNLPRYLYLPPEHLMLLK